MNFLRRFFTRCRIRALEAKFGGPLSPDVVKRMIETGEQPDLSGRVVEITPFFASVQDYVGFAERMPLVQLPGLLNAYFTASCEAIESEGGMVDKFIGDAIVATFGAPFAQPDHALRACVASLKMQTQVSRLRERLTRDPATWPAISAQLRVRIGLNTGLALVGNLGTATRSNYTMMGDNVNLAARIESGAKSWGVWCCAPRRPSAPVGRCSRTGSCFARSAASS